MTLHDALSLVSTLSAEDKLRLIDALARQLLDERKVCTAAPTSRFGALRDLGTAPSLDAIREARAEVWQRFMQEEMA